MGGIFGQQLVRDPLDLHRDTGTQGRERLRIGIQDAIDDRLFVVATERICACDHFIHHDAEGPEVGTGIHFFASGLLGTHVGYGAEC